MIKDEFRQELDYVMAMNAPEIQELKKAPKKGQSLSREEVEFVDQRIKASLIGAAPENAEQAQDNRDWVEAIRAYYKVDARDPEEKAELVLTAENYERWVNDFKTNKLLDESSIPFDKLPEPKEKRRTAFEVLGLR